MQAILFLALGVAAAIAAPSDPSRIVGGSEVSIDQYPYAVSMLYSSGGSGNFWQLCAGSIISEKSILSAAHCYSGNGVEQWRARVGSSYAISGGVVHEIDDFIIHRNFIPGFRNMDNDIAIVRVSSPFSFNDNVRPGKVEVDYFVRENDDVWAVGWGRTGLGQPHSEQLRHVQVKIVKWASCRNAYASIRNINLNHLCSGLPSVGGSDQCHGDAGGPLVHNGVIVGVCSWVTSCGDRRLPGLNTRVSNYVSWIHNNA